MRSRRPRIRPDRPANLNSSMRWDVPARIEMIVWTLLVGAFVFASSTAFTVEYTLPKLLALYLATPVLILLWIRRHLRRPMASVPRGIALCSVGMAGWWVVTSLTAVHRYTAFQGVHGRFNGLWTHLVWLTLFGLAATSSLTRAEIDARLRITAASLVGAALIAISQLLAGNAFPGGRAIATIGNAVILGACLSLGVPLAIGFALRAAGAARAAWAASAVVLAAGVAATGSRGPLAGLIASIALMAILVARDLRLRRSWLVAVCVAGAALAIAGAARTRTDAFIPSMQHLAAAESWRDRLNTMRAAAQIVGDRPLLGVGLENFSVVYPRYRTPEADRLLPDELPTMVHSGYLQLAATTGLPGLILYVALLVSVGASVVRSLRGTTDGHWRITLASLLTTIAGYLVADVSGWEEVSLTGLFWMLLGLASAAAYAAGQGQTAVAPRRRTPAIVAAGAWLVVTLVLAARFATVAAADWSLRHARETSDWGSERAYVENVLSHADGASAYFDAAGVRYGVRYGSTGERQLSDRAAELFETAHRLNPFDEYILIHRVDLETAALQKHAGAARPGAVSAAGEMTAHDWNNATTDVSVARFELARGSLSAALAAISRARTLRPESAAAL